MPNYKQIERFTSWDEIFPDPAEADRQFEAYLAVMREGFSSKTLERTETDPETDNNRLGRKFLKQ